MGGQQESEGEEQPIRWRSILQVPTVANLDLCNYWNILKRGDIWWQFIYTIYLKNHVQKIISLYFPIRTIW
jgi:hypothetical protein